MGRNPPQSAWSGERANGNPCGNLIDLDFDLFCEIYYSNGGE